MDMAQPNIKIFSGNSHPNLAREIANHIGIELGHAKVGRFADGEICVTIKESVRGSDVFVVQSTNYPVNENLMELLIMVDAFKRASAGTINVVIPYFGYSRQDRKAKPRDPISSKLVANLLTVAGVDSVTTMDLHTPQLESCFDIPVNHLRGMPILIEYYKNKIKNFNDVVITSPDVGSVSRARMFSEKLGCPLSIIDKRRQEVNQSEIMNVIGEVKNKKVIIVDDMIDTAGTICNASKALIERGAKEVYACCTHAIFSNPAIERIEESLIKELVVLNTVSILDCKLLPKIKVLSVGEMFGEVIKRIYNNVSISPVIDG